MSNLAVRARQEKIEPKTEAEIKKEIGPEVQVERVLDVEPPYLNYQQVKHRPYTADYFKLGPNWEDKTGGFKPEMDLLEDYVRGRIEQGQLDNTIEAVKLFYRKAEKMCGADKMDRVTMRIAKLAAYAKFLKETDNINLNQFKYGKT